jgi:nucleoside-diphosphate-sugar epimerase
MIIDLIGRDVEIEIDPARLRPVNSEVHRLLADNSRAHEGLGWYPRIALIDGLSKTIEWIRAHQDYFNPRQYLI